jgi:Tfp pilus assembly protein PilX
MKAQIAMLDNEKGSAMTMVLMMLLIMTIIGIAATRNTTVELKIAENDAAHKQALFNADSGIQFSLTLNENQVKDLPDNSPIAQVPAGSPYNLEFLQNVQIGPPRIIEVQARSGPDLTTERGDLLNSKGRAVITAGIQLQTPMSGAIGGVGDQYTY